MSSVAPTATAVYHLLAAYRDSPAAFADAHDARVVVGDERTAVDFRLGPVRHRGPPLGALRKLGIASTIVIASGIRISHTRPPTRPLRGLRGDLSQRASRAVDNLSDP